MWPGSLSGGRAAAGGSQRLNSANQLCSVFTWSNYLEAKVMGENEKKNPCKKRNNNVAE